MDWFTAATNRRSSIAAGLKTYTGKVCNKHPELNGERRCYNSVCYECAKERLSRWLASDDKV